MSVINYSKIPVLAGSGRSGTTWVLDALAIPNKRRTIFEPLHPACVPGANNFAHLFVKPDEKNEALYLFFKTLLTTKKLGTWIDYRVRSDRLQPSLDRFRSLHDMYEWYLRIKKFKRNKKKYESSLNKPPMIKMIRGNLLLGWLVQNFSMNIALLVRHPGAVIESMYRLGGDDWDSKKALSLYQKQDKLLQQLNTKSQNLISTATTDLERHMLTWCLENASPIQDAEKNGIKVIFYENLVTDSISEWKVLTSALGLNEVPDQSILKKPSQQAAPGKNDHDYTKTKLGHWMKTFSSSEINTMQNILNTFGVTCYRMNEPTPVIKLN